MLGDGGVSEESLEHPFTIQTTKMNILSNRYIKSPVSDVSDNTLTAGS
jgi:hypothetical protein